MTVGLNGTADIDRLHHETPGGGDPIGRRPAQHCRPEHYDVAFGHRECRRDVRSGSCHDQIDRFWAQRAYAGRWLRTRILGERRTREAATRQQPEGE